MNQNPESQVERQRGALGAVLRLWPVLIAGAVLAMGFFGARADSPEPESSSLTWPFAQWFEKCKDVPSNRREPLRWPPRALLPLPKYAQFETVIDAFLQHCKDGPLAAAERWHGNRPSDATFFNTRLTPSVDGPFEPFVQRLNVPPGSEVILHGDLHGDIRSLVRGVRALNERGYLDGFKITKPNTYMVFLGDYTDRGLYGVEVIYTILRLKLANPERVWLVRGNHEDLKMVLEYGFVKEGVYKYGRAFQYKKVTRIYDFLPVALFLGCGENYVQCNHGGMEPGYDASGLLASEKTKQFHLLGELKRADFRKKYPDFVRQLSIGDDTVRFFRLLYQNFRMTSPRDPDLLGFLWGDFALQAHEPALRWDEMRPGGGWMHGEKGTRLIFDHYSSKGPRVHAAFRAHQHSRVLDPMMRRLLAGDGLFEHWQDADVAELTQAKIPLLRERLESRRVDRPLTKGAVYTLNVSPDSVYGLGCGYDFDAFAILRTAESFEDWRLEVMRVDGAAGK